MVGRTRSLACRSPRLVSNEAKNSSPATTPFSVNGWRTVVNPGSKVAACGMSSNPTMLSAPGTPHAIVEQNHRDAAQQHVQASAELLRASGFKAVEIIRAGHPADTIVTHAIADRPDLIVLGAQSLNGLRGRVVGSVSGKVARYAPTSVLVARTAGPIRSVLLGYDASPDADEALELVAPSRSAGAHR